MRACHARAPCCAGCDRFTHDRRILHRRMVSLSLSLQDRGATCELWLPTHSRHSLGTRASACSAGGRPSLHLVICARAARHGIQTRSARCFEFPAAKRWRFWWGRDSAAGVRKSAQRVGPHHNHAKSALRGACSAGSAVIPWCDTCVGRAARESITVIKMFRSFRRRPIAQSVGLSLGRRRGEECAACWPVGPQHNHAKSAPRRLLRGRSADLLHDAIRSRAPRHGIRTR